MFSVLCVCLCLCFLIVYSLCCLCYFCDVFCIVFVMFVDVSFVACSCSLSFFVMCFMCLSVL